MDNLRYIKYKGGYKYQLVEDYKCKTNICPLVNIHTEYISLTISGWLTIRSGYAFDGPSGPAIDTKNFMRGSLVHDAFYQLMREEKLQQKWRIPADKELQRLCREDGMSLIRSTWVYLAVKFFGGPNASKKNERKVQKAP